MTTDTLSLAQRASRIAEGDGPDALGRLSAPGVAAAIWRRSLPGVLSGWLDALAPDRLPRFRARLAVADVGAAVDAACGIAGLAAGPARTALAAELGALAKMFGQLLQTDIVEARLDVIATDACHRFHVDRVRARLLCTLRGPGTEFALPAAADVRVVRPLARGEVALMRGTLWPGEETALLHRSPPIDGTGIVRLLFVLDVPGDEDDDDCGCCP
jgi:hypothetical protein